MTLLVTGGTGFVMSVVARAWLDRDPQARAVILDRSGLDAAAEKHFAPVRDRLTVISADILDAKAWSATLDRQGITAIVHGATITPISRGSASEAKRQPEAEDPARIVDVNLMGTVRMLDWARTNPDLKRFIYVSSGSVYRHNGPDWSGEPLPEDGYVAPLTLYGISKFASEMVTNRYADLFGLSAVSVRLASVYGPMDRATESRNFRHVPNRVAHMALAGETIRPNSLEPVGDYVTSTDVAAAILALIDAQHLNYRHYNIGSGSSQTIGEIIGWAREREPGLKAEVTPGEDANIVQDVRLKGGMWGAYDIARIMRDTEWRPCPGKEAFHAYMDWIAANEN
ncbi:MULTISPECIES: NAD(P)-dependent oxidoreductase [unclassified Mesorhizobium]|uniref:NAD-dependent epimerase/dehydratase family protein n=1 Tax=unclassified Mesorhizobium TaxID=325217 RepID=UPI000F75167A|nr:MULTISPECIES: NAD(P)-dependent oxidoreductase [unclassified Mesorhizobium]AZO02054.1 NAD(P)-dependent oxidoreductase [Mesorhizobium sp. M2A.F.Ca.ET.043.02.1.1]RUW38751.1 NAD(P)-dependent oxidoreductase [Mesorhizobium sp. M2A.F.Ca.ET.015.02.1.1]RUW77830.1 NAD(P)-dependent oxidoreductase [Mesorhizobium sp. M2A.F.Ca.ET.067.02.1.1]RVC94062.1 NAD(P)-dependent oxidoreductase [Mesorhizobium sp. M2A.F.Ca.ET.017.03.2.1]RVD11992.1 NAD(P)-dependent oxidoreductase [Mesorhizobium sp. M2A.F.Ca.ET.029.05.